MPDTRTANVVRLEFAPGRLVQANLSGAAFTGDRLWAAGDEACGVERLRRLDRVGREVLRFGDVRDLPPTLAGRKPSWLVLYDAPGSDRKEGEHTVFGDLLRHD